MGVGASGAPAPGMSARLLIRLNDSAAERSIAAMRDARSPSSAAAVRSTHSPIVAADAGDRHAPRSSAMSCAVAYRFAASRSSPFMTTRSSSAGSSGTMELGGITSSLRTRRKLSASLSPKKSRRPVRISQSTTEAAKMSVRRVKGCPCTCSGAM